MRDLTGQVFGRLTVLYRDGHLGKRIAYRCVCACGQQVRVSGDKLNSGTKSCGCLRSETSRRLIGEYRDTLPRDIETAGLKLLFAGYKQGAKKRNLVFDMTLEQFQAMTKLPCMYCGRQPTQIKTGRRTYGKYTYNGIDRIDNTQGYVQNNVGPCCQVCNRAKRDMTHAEFMRWVSDLIKYNS